MVWISLSVRLGQKSKWRKSIEGDMHTTNQPIRHELWWFWLFTCSNENYVQSISCISSSKLFTSESHVISKNTIFFSLHHRRRHITTTVLFENRFALYFEICHSNWNIYTVERNRRSSTPCVSHEQKTKKKNTDFTMHGDRDTQPKD